MSSNTGPSGERGAQAASPRSRSVNQSNSTQLESDTDAMKRAAARQRIERYYYQLTDGCGKNYCENENCASSKNCSRKNITKNEAAILSIELFKKKSLLCEDKAAKIAKVPEENKNQRLKDEQPSTSVKKATDSNTDVKAETKSPAKKSAEFKYLTESITKSLIKTCTADSAWAPLIRTIGQVYNNPDNLKKSFLKEERKTDKKGKDKKEEEAQAGCGENITVDLESVRRTYDVLFSVPNHPFLSALTNAIIYLADNLEMSLRHHEEDSELLNVCLIIMEIPVLHSPEFLDGAFPAFARAMGYLSGNAQAKLVRFWSKFTLKRLKSMLESLQQLVTVRVVSQQWNQRKLVNDDSGIAGACKIMKLIFYACLYGGYKDPPSLVEQEMAEESDNIVSDFLLQGAVGHESKDRQSPKEDPLAKELKVRVLDCRKPLIHFLEFVNDALNDVIEVDQDFMFFKQDDKFSFMNYSFILNTTTKNLGMYFDNRIRMLNERRSSLLQSLVHGAPTMPYLRLRIRRDHVIDDALVGLEMAAMDNPPDLKKQLYVEFDGEQGIDEGGVSKEFFQLVIEELFNPDFGMFIYYNETQSFWFNSTSFENDGQFLLIGIIVGLAIYNHIILDIQFPMVVYRKLMGKRGIFADMLDSHPTLARSLKNMLEYEGDVEEDFLINFVAGDSDVFGSALTHILKDGGESIPVTNENRQEYVDLYADYLLNKSIEKQFKAFKRGFQMVTDESPLKMLFRPDEVELLVCGSKDWDFHALEAATEYDGGFTSTSTTIRNFWDVVHSFDEEQKKKLLQFTTGSDRVPVGGLAKLKLIIAKNGSDSYRLPTSHTCFNVLLLPDYSHKDKLQERLLKAITHAKGFGML